MRLIRNLSGLVLPHAEVTDPAVAEENSAHAPAEATDLVTAAENMVRAPAAAVGNLPDAENRVIDPHTTDQAAAETDRIGEAVISGLRAAEISSRAGEDREIIKAGVEGNGISDREAREDKEISDPVVGHGDTLNPRFHPRSVSTCLFVMKRAVIRPRVF